MNLKCDIWTSVSQQAGALVKQVANHEDSGNIIMEANFIRQLLGIL